MSHRTRQVWMTVFAAVALLAILFVFVTVSLSGISRTYAAGDAVFGAAYAQQPTPAPDPPSPVITSKNLDLLAEHDRVWCPNADNLAWSPSGELLALSCRNDLLVLNMQGAKAAEPLRMVGHTDSVQWLAWSLDGTVLISASRDGSLRVWKVEAEAGSGAEELFVAASVDVNGCAGERQDVFGVHDTVYVVLENADISQGTTLFVRLYHSDTPLEDSAELTADQNYEDVCANFLFEPVEGAAFDVGQYEAELFVGGVSSGSVSFMVR